MVNMLPRLVAPVLLVSSLGLTGAATGPAPAPAPTEHRAPGVRGELLPVPPVRPGRQLSVTAVDVSPAGSVAGNAQVTTTAADGTTSAVDSPLQWTTPPRGDWRLRRLALPDGATSGDGLLAGEAELVARDGTRTPLRGTPELDAGYRRGVSSIGGPDTALVGVTNGIGQGTTAAPVLWQAGATVRLPVFSSYFLGPACASRVQPDGDIVVSGFSNTGGGLPRWLLLRHTGGVPGTDTVLSEATASGQLFAELTCTPGLTSNSLAPDGGIAGSVIDADRRRTAAYWDAANQRTTIPLLAGERSTSGVAAASGGRMVILAEAEDGSTSLSLWQHGIRTPLPAPRGFTVASVVELTEAGLLVANLRDAAGAIRPASWNLRR